MAATDGQPEEPAALLHLPGHLDLFSGRGSADLSLQMKRADGKTSTHWLKAKSSEFKVGAEQKETAETIAKAIAEGSAVAMPIGIRRWATRSMCSWSCSCRSSSAHPRLSHAGVRRTLHGRPVLCDLGAICRRTVRTSIQSGGCVRHVSRVVCSVRTAGRGHLYCRSRLYGKGPGSGLDGSRVQNWARHEAEHATATHPLPRGEGRSPSAQDITAAIDQLEALYAKFAHGTRRQDATSVNAPMDIRATNPDIPKFTFAPPTNAAFPQ